MADRPDGVQDPTGEASPSRLVDAAAVLRAAFSGLVVLLPVTVIVAFIEREADDFDDSAWPMVLFVVLLLVFTFTGWCAGRLAPSAPLTNGAMASLTLLAGWIPIRVVIWVLRDDSRGLVSGDDPVFTIGGVFGLAVAATAMGMVGGWFSTRAR